MNPLDVGATPNSKPNPFVQGSKLEQDAESAVQAFLMSEASKKSMLLGLNSDQIDSGTNYQANPGKIEDLPSPTGPFGQMQVSIFFFELSINHNTYLAIVSRNLANIYLATISVRTCKQWKLRSG